MLTQKFLIELRANNLTFFNFKLTAGTFLLNCFLAQLSIWYLGQILEKIEKNLILYLVAFMSLEIAKQLLSNF